MKKNREKRNRKVELGKEAIALKKMREYRSMSVSFTQIKINKS